MPMLIHLPPKTATAAQDWVKSRQIDCIYVALGSPWENGYVGSFHSHFRNDCLNHKWFINELDAKVAIGDWREHYYESRPHSGIDYYHSSGFFFEFRNVTSSCHILILSAKRDMQPTSCAAVSAFAGNTSSDG